MPTVDHPSLVSTTEATIALLARAIAYGEESIALKAAGDEDGAHASYQAMCAIQSKCADDLDENEMLAHDLLCDLRNAEAAVLDHVVTKLLDEDLREGDAETVRAFFTLIKELP